jgi:hypothetical protein
MPAKRAAVHLIRGHGICDWPLAQTVYPTSSDLSTGEQNPEYCHHLEMQCNQSLVVPTLSTRRNWQRKLP